MKLMTFMAVVATLALVGCDSKASRQEDKRNEYYMAHYGAYQSKNCITEHLNEMSDSDGVQKWDAALYNAVAAECDKLMLAGGNLNADKK